MQSNSQKILGKNLPSDHLHSSYSALIILNICFACFFFFCFFSFWWNVFGHFVCVFSTFGLYLPLFFSIIQKKKWEKKEKNIKKFTILLHFVRLELVKENNSKIFFPFIFIKNLFFASTRSSSTWKYQMHQLIPTFIIFDWYTIVWKNENHKSAALGYSGTSILRHSGTRGCPFIYLLALLFDFFFQWMDLSMEQQQWTE